MSATIIKEAFSNAKLGGSPQSQRENKPPAPKPTSLNPKKGAAGKDGKDALTDAITKAMAAVRAIGETTRRQAKSAAKTTTAETAEEVALQNEAIEQVAEIRWADDEASDRLADLNREKGRHPRGSSRANEVRDEIGDFEEQIGAIRSALAAIEAANPSAYVEGTQRYNARCEAAEMAMANRKIIGSAKPADIGSRIDGGVAAGFMAKLAVDQAAEYKAEGWPTVTFKREAYGSTQPEDESISDVTASVAELLDNLQQRNSDRDAITIAELRRGGYYVSDRHEPDGKGNQLPSELDLLREAGVVKSASKFLTLDPTNTGQRYVVRAGRGFTVLENREGRPVAVKTSDPQTGHAVFTTPDRNSGGRMARPSAPDIANGKPISLTDLSAVWYQTLRLALESDLRRETESADRREAADELRDLSDVPDLITAYALQQGQAGTVVVDAKVGERETRVTMRLNGDDKTKTFMVTRHVPGTIAKVDPEGRWLARAFDKDGQSVPMSIDVLKRGEWRELITANGWIDRNWQLARKANELDAAMVTADNVGDLTDTEGKDGLYAFTVNDRRDDRNNPRRRPTDPVKHWDVPLGFIVKREGQIITPVWGVPGPSANKLEKLGADALNINDLTPMFKAILRNLLFAVAPRDEKGQRVRIEVPNHLKSATTNTGK